MLNQLVGREVEKSPQNLKMYRLKENTTNRNHKLCAMSFKDKTAKYIHLEKS